MKTVWQPPRFIVTETPAVRRLEATSGLRVRAKAFGLMDRFRIRRGRPVFWEIPNRTPRIAAYYADANGRLADTHGIRF